MKGTEITPVLCSSFGEPRAFEIRNTLIVIRKEDCKFIDILLNSKK